MTATIVARVDFDTDSGSFDADIGNGVTWTGGDAGTLHALRDGISDIGIMWIEVTTGNAPTNNQTITGTTSGNTCLAVGTSTGVLMITGEVSTEDIRADIDTNSGSMATVDGIAADGSTNPTIADQVESFFLLGDLLMGNSGATLTNWFIEDQQVLIFCNNFTIAGANVRVGKERGFEFDYDAGSGTFVVNEFLEWDSGASTGQLVQFTGTTTGDMEVILVTGSLPADNDVIDSVDTAATCSVNEPTNPVAFVSTANSSSFNVVIDDAGSPREFKLLKEAALDVFSSQIITNSNVSFDGDFTRFKIEDSIIRLIGGAGVPGGGSIGNTPDYIIRRSSIVNQTAFALNTVNADINYDFEDVSLNTFNAFQVGTDPITLTGFDLTKIVFAHLAGPTGLKDVTFVNCGVFDVLFFTANSSDIAAIQFTYDAIVAEADGTPIAGARYYLEDQTTDVRFNGVTSAAGRPAHEGTHTGSNNAAVLTDSAADFGPTNGLIGFTITNDTDGSSARITANTSTTITGVLSGGSENDWDNVIPDAYTVLLTTFQETTWVGNGNFQIGTPTERATHTRRVKAYGFVYTKDTQSAVEAYAATFSVLDNSFTDVNLATALALTGIAITGGATDEIVVTASRTSQQIYDFSQAWDQEADNVTETDVGPMFAAPGQAYEMLSGWTLVTDQIISGGINLTGNMELSALFDLTVAHNITGTLTITTAGTYTITDSTITTIDNATASTVLIKTINSTVTTLTSTGGGAITKENPVTVTVTVLDATTGLPISGARVFIETDPGEVELTNDSTDVNGEVVFTVTDLTADQLIKGTIRKGTTSIKYKSFNVASTITIAGNVFALTAQLIPDE